MKGMKGARHKWVCTFCGWKNAIWRVSPVGRLIHERWKPEDGLGELPIVPCSWVRCRKCYGDFALVDRVTCLACEKCWAIETHSGPRLIFYDDGHNRYSPLGGIK
jgi:hypothetical protein